MIDRGLSLTCLRVEHVPAYSLTISAFFVCSELLDNGQAGKRMHAVLGNSHRFKLKSERAYVARDLGKFISGRTKGGASLTWLYNLEHLGKRSKPRLGVGPRAASTVLATQNRLCSSLCFGFP